MASTTRRQEADDERRDKRAAFRIDQRLNNLRAELFEIGRRNGLGKARDQDQARRREIVAELDDPEDALIYDLGLDAGEQERPPPAPAKPKPAASSSARRPSSSARRRPPARRRSSRRSVPAQAAANLYRPVRGQLVSGAQLLGMVAAVLLLSAMLQTADTWTGIFRKAADAFDWLADPARSIPYGPNHP